MERLPTCPACKAIGAKTVKVHSPDTRDMNSPATLECFDCAHQWEGLVTSPWLREQQEKGNVLL